MKIIDSYPIEPKETDHTLQILDYMDNDNVACFIVQLNGPASNNFQTIIWRDQSLERIKAAFVVAKTTLKSLVSNKVIL